MKYKIIYYIIEKQNFAFCSQPFFQKLQVWTNISNITLYNSWSIADTIYVEVNYKYFKRSFYTFCFFQRVYNKTPAWANDEGVLKNLSDINELSFHFLYANDDTKRIRGGLKVYLKRKRFNKIYFYRSNNTRYVDEYESIKIWRIILQTSNVFSCMSDIYCFDTSKFNFQHDTTVSPALAFLGINYRHQPQVAKNIFLIIDFYI